MKIIVFGIGDYYFKFKYMIENEEIIVFLDNDKNKNGIVFDNKAIVVRPDEVLNYEYDRIYLASMHMRDMFMQLVELGVPANKIFDIREALDVNSEAKEYKRYNQKQNRVYVYCPIATTGGPEALHQLADSIYRNITHNVYMVYYGENKIGGLEKINQYEMYKNGGIVSEEEVMDVESSIVVIPEVNLEKMDRFNYANIYLWWLSVDNFFHHREQHLISALEGMKRVSVHMCQSFYARQFLSSCGIENCKVFMISDYTNVGKTDILEEKEKENIVLYNPAKGFFYTFGLIQVLNDIGIKTIPIKDFTKEEVADLMKRAKVYIDFGGHPGKDRMPREAARGGCCIITGKKGAAGNDYDIKISKRYKFDQNLASYAEISDCIRECVYNYEEKTKDFNDYRQEINQEKEIFDQEVIKLFG